MLSEIFLDGCPVLRWAFFKSLYELSIGEDQTVQHDQEWEQVEVDYNEEEPYKGIYHIVEPLVDVC